MKLKPAIQIVENSNAALIIALFIVVLAIVTRSGGDAKLLVFEILFAIPFLLAYFLRMVLINLYLKKCKYPIVFLAVLNKLNLTRDFDINWSEDAQKDFDSPTYSTEIFLSDNGLVTDIGDNSSNLWMNGKQYQKNPAPLIQFTNKSLFINAGELDWKDIFDWNYEAGANNSPSKILISYYDAEKNIYETVGNMAQIKCDKIDLMLLLTHYKAKYG